MPAWRPGRYSVCSARQTVWRETPKVRRHRGLGLPVAAQQPDGGGLVGGQCPGTPREPALLRRPPDSGRNAALDRIQFRLRRPGHHPQDDLAHHPLDLGGVGAEGVEPGLGGSQGGDAHPAPVQRLHDRHQFNPVAADPVQGGDGDGIAAEQTGVQSGPPRAFAGRDGAGDSHVGDDVYRVHAGVGQDLDLGFGVHAGQAVDGGPGGADIAVNHGLLPLPKNTGVLVQRRPCPKPLVWGIVTKTGVSVTDRKGHHGTFPLI